MDKMMESIDNAPAHSTWIACEVSKVLAGKLISYAASCGCAGVFEST
jgi:hypothetical protein